MKELDGKICSGILANADVSMFKGNKKVVEETYSMIVKSMRFLGFFEDDLLLTIKDKTTGKARSCLDCIGDVMAARMEHTKNDRDLVVMRHNFILENEKLERWAHTSTWIGSGAAASSGGYSLMS